MLFVVGFHFGFSRTYSIVGLAAILYADFRFTRATSFPDLSTALPCFAAAAIIHAGTSCRTMASRLLSLPPIRFIGLVSHS